MHPSYSRQSIPNVIGINSFDFENQNEGREAMMRQQISDYSNKLKANNLIEMRS